MSHEAESTSQSITCHLLGPWGCGRTIRDNKHVHIYLVSYIDYFSKDSEYHVALTIEIMRRSLVGIVIGLHDVR